MSISEAKLNEFLGKAVGDLGAAMSATLMLVGDRLGLYKELAKGSTTSADLAMRTGTNERYIREWLVNQAASEYVDYDPATGRYSLAPEQAVALTDENSPFFVGGGFISAIDGQRRPCFRTFVITNTLIQGISREYI